ncbi:MAG: response regulator [Chloroflexota bacterium]|nr:response regulator [Chloroflexota bacterium]
MSTVLIIDDDPSVLRLLDFAMGKAGFQVILAGDGDTGLEQAQNNLPDLAVVDVMMPGLDGYEVCRRLRADPRTAKMAIIILTARSQAVDRKVALEAGADEHMVKPVMPDELIRLAREIMARPRVTAPTAELAQGRVVTTFSLRGGVGVTSLAVNLAVALARMRQEDIPLLDLSLLAGHAALMFNLQPQFTLADLLRQGAELDEETIEQYLARHSSGVRVLAAPSRPMIPAPGNGKAVTHIVSLLKDRFPYVVADTASSLDEVTAAMLTASDLVLFLVAAEVQALQTAIASLPALRDLGLADDNLWLVLNQHTPQPPLPAEAAKKALRRSVQATVPYEPALLQAIQRGVPLIIHQPRSPMATAVAKLAYRIDKHFEGMST